MKIFGLHILTAAQLAAVKQFATNEFDQAVAAAKSTEIGKAAAAAVQAVEQPGATGEQKMVGAIAAVAPVVLSYAAKGGFAGVVADAEQFARAVIETTLADLKQTKALSIAAVILKLLGIK